jgi:UDP-N-acetylmuramate dehydrogenase
MLLSDLTGIQVAKSEVGVCDLKNILSECPDICCDENILASSLTSFCVGGKVNYLISINSESSISFALESIRQTGLPVYMLGAGTNMLVSDDGFRGIFVRLGENFRKIERISERSLLAWSAYKLSDLVAYLIENNLGDMAFLSGIPGTVGGAVAMNAGAFGDEIKNHVISVQSVGFDGQLYDFKCEDCGFEYRNSRFKRGKDIVISSVLRITPGQSIRSDVDKYLEHRKQRHIPKGHYAGSVFKNPPGDYAGKLLDEAGMRGMRIGTAYVSDKHANFILADRDGRASDVLELMLIGALRVFHFNGIKLYPEIDLIGFEMEWDEIFIT